MTELILSYGGRLGNNSNTKDLLTAEDVEGVTALHHAARAGHNDVLNALLTIAWNLDVDVCHRQRAPVCYLCAPACACACAYACACACACG